mmetsp:Transcript_56323/g.100329  ORF Transcript_56323/g.100329 Transcript_56323/m.100329 type:complete len:294 (+) Transcript_56323:278-1159(+)
MVHIPCERGRGAGLIRGVVQVPQKRVGQQRGGGGTADRAGGQHLCEQVLGVGDAVHAGRAEGLEQLRHPVTHAEGGREAVDQVQLVLAGGAGEQGPAIPELPQDAPGRPDVDRRGVPLRAPQQLRRPVVPGDHVVGHVAGLVHVEPAGQPQVADPQLAVLREQNVVRLQVPVHHAGGVQVFQAPEDLVNDVLDVVLGQELPAIPQDPLQVGQQPRGDHVHVREQGPARHVHVDQGQQVFVGEERHQLQLPEDALAVLQGGEDLVALLDGHPPPRAVDLGLHDAAVGTNADGQP